MQNKFKAVLYSSHLHTRICNFTGGHDMHNENGSEALKRKLIKLTKNLKR
jgi:hypothetical protein